MPPIPIHKNAPIKPDGITPSTTTADSSNNPTPTRTIPASTPATTTSTSSNPPAPQPGVRPAPPTQAATPYNTSSPAPPQPGAAPSTGGYTAHHLTTETYTLPPQFTQPPPTDSALAGRSTTTSTTASKPGPTTLSYGPVASPFQSADTATRMSMEQAPRKSLEHPPGYQQAPDNAPYTSGGGIGGTTDRGEGSGSGEGVGAAAWNLLGKAGEALKKGEEAAWKAMKGK